MSDPGSPAFRALQDEWCAVTYALEHPVARSIRRPAETQPLYGTTSRAGWRLADPSTTTSVSFLDSDLVGTIGGALGMWHNHPNGDVTPSDHDLSTALHLRDEYGLPQFVTLILPTGGDAWAAPRLAAWAVRRSPLGRAVYERVKV